MIVPRCIFLLLLLTLAGCAVLPPQPTPAVPSQNSAVVALLSKARQQRDAGELEQAGANLERALRIEPRNARLWQELAQLRLDQGLYRQAESLAAKSNGFAAGERSLRAQNWRIIGEARSALGDFAGARSAFERAERE